MTDLLFYLLIVATVALLIGGLLRRGGYIEYPFLAAMVYAGWFLPQAAAIRTEAFLPEFGLALVLGMALLCLGGIVLGWKLGTASRPRRPPSNVRIDRLLWLVAGLTAFATLMRLLIGLQSAEVRAMDQWTGPLSILVFFGSVGLVSLSSSILLYFYRKSAKTLALLGWNLALYAPAVLIYFRRADTGELFLAVACGLWFARRISIPRAFIVGGLVIGVMFVHAAGQLRNLSGAYDLDTSGQITTRLPTLEEISKIDFFGTSPQGGRYRNLEMRNAVYYMSSIERRSDLTLGAEFWDALVFRYVPGQIVGFEFKQSLMIGSGVSNIALEELNYETRTGVTSTGFVHAYRDFWFFGALVFLATGYCMGRAYSLALTGSLFGQILYMSTIVAALHTVTHFSYHYFLKIPLLLGAILFVFWAAKGRRFQTVSSRTRAANLLRAHVGSK